MNAHRLLVRRHVPAIPGVMTWELLRRGRWGLPLAALGSACFTAFIFAALLAQGLQPQHPTLVLLHMFMIGFNFVLFGFAIVSSQPRMARLYALPARTSTLVAWQLWPAMALMAAQTLALAAVLNAAFDLHWPLWGPALFLATALACHRAAWWIAERSRWAIAAFVLVDVVLILWFKARYGPMFGEPRRMWSHVTLAEGLAMAAALAAAFAVSVYGVARNRRGEPPITLGVVARLLGLLERRPHALAPFAGAAQAQAWFQWRRRGLVMPAAVAFIIVVGLILWLFVSRNPRELIHAFAGGAGMLWLIGSAGGLAFGNVGPKDGNFSLGNFMATRPMTTAAMARILLATAAASLLVAWAIWAATFAVAAAAIWLVGRADALVMPQGIDVWYFPATLAAAWIAVGAWMTLFIAACRPWTARIVVALLASVVAAMLASAYLLNPTAQLVVQRLLVAGLSLAAIAGTIGAFAAARRRNLVTSPMAALAAVAWLAFVGLLAAQWPFGGAPSALAFIALTSLGALVAAPLATVPLALRFNRTR